MTLQLGVLISGRGSNLVAVSDAIDAGRLDAKIRVVVTNNPDAPGIVWAQTRGIPAVVVRPNGFENRAQYEQSIVESLLSNGVDWVLLAGYMKLVGKTLLSRFKNKMVNIHPSLLPLYKGLEAQKQALDAGATESGCTVHLVNLKMDDGPILGQRRVPVVPGDTVATLSDRILVQEHQLLPEVLQSIALGSMKNTF